MNIVSFDLKKNINSCQEGDIVTFDKDSFNNNELNINIENDKKFQLIFKDLPLDLKLTLTIGEGCNIRVSFLADNVTKNVEFNAKIMQKSHLLCYFADFSKNEISVSTNIELEGEDASCIWNLASLSRNQDNKKFDISIYHLSPYTNSAINNFGVAKDFSKLVFSGICKIFNKCSNSKANQNAKIIVFDEGCDAKAKPILKIDENNVEASHAAVVGKISDDQLFYLTSRGISLEKSRELITYGYLKPIIEGFDIISDKEKIKNLIEETL